MRIRLLILATLVGGSASFVSPKTSAWQPAAGHLTLPLWPNGAPGAPPNSVPEADTTTAKDNLIAGKPLIRLGNVFKSQPHALPCTRQEHGRRRGCLSGRRLPHPGHDLEGTEVCDWLNS